MNENTINTIEEIENPVVCARCGCTIPENESFRCGEDVLCDDCASEHTALCDDCGERFYIDDDRGDETRFICPSCYDNNWTHCERCGALIRSSESYTMSRGEYADCDLCGDCHDIEMDKIERVIHDYYYKPEPIFYGSGPLYMGVELEVDGAGEDHGNAGDVMEVFNANGEYAYCKHDGSLNDGFEIVTHPMSLAFHKNNAPWADVVDKCRKLGYTSHNVGTCGLHVHVSRDAFGNDDYTQDAAISRVLYFFEKNWEELLKFSRRTQYQLDRWAARYGYEHDPMDILDKAKGAGRYTAVNLENTNTVEFRMFRGTLKYNTIIATMELLNIVCGLAVNLSTDEIRAMSWTDFVDGIDRDENPELIQYLKERRLYVNEPIESDPEV